MGQLVAVFVISILAPRGGSDVSGGDMTGAINIFQSSLPAGGATIAEETKAPAFDPFQSSLPAGGATLCLPLRACIPTISILAPRGGERRSKSGLEQPVRSISILAPRGGSDSYSIYT